MWLSSQLLSYGETLQSLDQLLEHPELAGSNVISLGSLHIPLRVGG